MTSHSSRPSTTDWISFRLEPPWSPARIPMSSKRMLIYHQPDLWLREVLSGELSQGKVRAEIISQQVRHQTALLLLDICQCWHVWPGWRPLWRPHSCSSLDVMEGEQTTGSRPGPSQVAAVSAQLSLGTKGTDAQQLLSIKRGSHTRSVLSWNRRAVVPAVEEYGQYLSFLKINADLLDSKDFICASLESRNARSAFYENTVLICRSYKHFWDARVSHFSCSANFWDMKQPKTLTATKCKCQMC